MWVEPKELGPLTPKPVYQDLVCSKCWQANHDEVFKRGFKAAGEFKSKRDLIQTTDGFLCLSEKVRELLIRHRVGGFKIKPIGMDGWYVVNVTKRVNAVLVYKAAEECRLCRRAKQFCGGYEFERQISLPKNPRTVFTVVHERQGPHQGRDVFVTGDIVEILQTAGIKGCRFNKMYSSEEENEMKRRRRGGKEWWPPGACIDL